MIQRLRLIMFATVALVALLGAFTPGALSLTLAQPERPLALVEVDTFGSPPVKSLVVFSGEGKQAGKLPFPATVNRPDLSSDGKWVVLQNYDQKTQVQSIQYYRVNGKPESIAVDKDFNVLNAEFSSDSRYLLYSLTSFSSPQPDWILGILELSTGKKAEFAGKVGFPNGPQAPFPGSPLPFDFNGSQLLFFAIPIGTEGYPLGIYSVAIPALNDGRSALPPVKSLRKNQNPPLQVVRVSPDGTKVAYLFNDQANPPANYKPQEMPFTVNAIGVIDLATGDDRVVAKAGKGQALETLAWWYTGNFLVFTGGNYQQSDRIISPRFYSVDVSTGTVTDTPPITFSDNPKESVLSMLPCSSGLFFVTQVVGADPGQRSETLYVAPLKDPKAGKKLLSGSGMHMDLRKCVAAMQ